MILFLYGADTFRSRQQLKKMVEKFKADRDPQGYNTTVLNCADTKNTDGQILEQFVAIPFLAEKRMLVLENLLSATGRGDLQEEILKRIKEKKNNDSTVLLFWEGEGVPKTKVSKELFEILKKEKFAQEFALLAGVKLVEWVESEYASRGGKISRYAAQYLAQNIGGDMWRLNSVIDQLVAYKNGSEIELTDTHLFLEEKIDDNIFNLVDAIVAGQQKKSFEMIQEQYRKGEDAGYVFSMLLRQFRILLEIRDLYEREDCLPSDIIAKKLDLHPFVVKKSLPFVKRYTLQNLKDIYQRLLEIDIKTKTGQGDQSLMLDLFVSKLS